MKPPAAAPAVDTAKARHDFLMSFRDGGKSSKTPAEVKVVSAPQLWEGGFTPGAPQARKKAPKAPKVKAAISAQDVLKGLADQGRLGNKRKPPRQQQQQDGHEFLEPAPPPQKAASKCRVGWFSTMSEPETPRFQVTRAISHHPSCCCTESPHLIPMRPLLLLTQFLTLLLLA